MRLIVIAVVAGMVSGCVSVKQIPMDSSSASAIGGRTVVLTEREKPSFGAMTVGKAMFGALGAAAMISAGNKIVGDNNVDDPAPYISSRLSKELADKRSVGVSDKKMSVTGSSQKEIMGSSQDLILDVMTVNWSVAYFPTDWSHYRVIYSAKASLIDAKSKVVLAEGFCAKVPEQTPESPTYDQLLANGAERLKQELKMAADYCVGEFLSKTFGI